MSSQYWILVTYGRQPEEWYASAVGKIVRKSKQDRVIVERWDRILHLDEHPDLRSELDKKQVKFKYHIDLHDDTVNMPGVTLQKYCELTPEPFGPWKYFIFDHMTARVCPYHEKLVYTFRDRWNSSRGKEECVVCVDRLIRKYGYHIGLEYSLVMGSPSLEEGCRFLRELCQYLLLEG